MKDYFLQLGVTIPSNLDWQDLVAHVSANWKGKLLDQIINKIVLASLVYYIWQERNSRMFQSQFRTTRQVIASIIESVRFKIMGLRIRISSRTSRTLERWNIFWESDLS